MHLRIAEVMAQGSSLITEIAIAETNPAWKSIRTFAAHEAKRGTNFSGERDDEPGGYSRAMASPSSGVTMCRCSTVSVLHRTRLYLEAYYEPWFPPVPTVSVAADRNRGVDPPCADELMVVACLWARTRPGPLPSGRHRHTVEAMCCQASGQVQPLVGRPT